MKLKQEKETSKIKNNVCQFENEKIFTKRLYILRRR